MGMAVFQWTLSTEIGYVPDLANSPYLSSHTLDSICLLLIMSNN